MKAFLRGLSAVTFVNVVNGVLGVVIVPLAVKRLGVDGYGLYSIFSVLAGYLILVELGLGKNLVRLLGGASTDDEVRGLLQLALGVYVGIAGTLFLLAPLILPFVTSVLFRVPAAHVLTVRWITITAIVDYLLGIPSSLRWNYALSRERIAEYARFMLQSNCTRYLFLLAGVLTTHRAEVAVAFVLGRRLIDLAVAPILLPPLPTGSWRPRLVLNECRALIGQSSLLAMTQLLQQSTVVVGSVLVNMFFGLTALGIYRSTFDIVSKVWFFSNTAQTVLYPRFIQLLQRERSRARLLRILPGAQAGSWAAYCLLGAVGTVSATRILGFVRLGTTTTPLLFSLLLIGVLWNAHAILSNELLQASGQFRRVAEVAAVSFVVMLIVFLVLSLVMPVDAIGWAWVLSQFVSSALIDMHAMRGLRGHAPFLTVLRDRLPAAFLAIAALSWRLALPMLPALLMALVGVSLTFAQSRHVRAAMLDLFGRVPVSEGV